MKLIVHMIANAHLDPVWLWTWPAGVDEALATCRTGCDLLDECPELIITRGDSWIYEQIYRIDPQLFARIERHVAQERWRIVNGWYVQPDCNQPKAESFLKQHELGNTFLNERFGRTVDVGYNVDSFGHCAIMPDLLRSMGMDAYVFMRPDAKEKTLPGNLFQWQGSQGGAVTTFRISRAYTSRNIADLRANLDQTIVDANTDVGHTMCFFGVGDHGGGPTRAQVDWISNNLHYQEEVELRFSHPRAFFDAVASSGIELPVVAEELQRHAIGCYTVVHEIKQQTRRAESLAIQAGNLVERYPDLTDATAKHHLHETWQNVCFNQFHDTLGGTSIEEAYEHARDELGLAKARSRRTIVDITRRAALNLEPCENQRLILTNASATAFDGWLEFEPWLGQHSDIATLPIRLIDDCGNCIPCQRIISDAAVQNIARVLFKAEVPALGRTVYQIAMDREDQFSSNVQFFRQSLSNGKIGLRCGPCGIVGITPADRQESLISAEGMTVAVYEDPSDTWTHGQDRYQSEPCGMFTSDKEWALAEQGPFRTILHNEFRMGQSSLQLQVLLYADDPIVRMRIRLNWQEKHRLAKLIIPPTFKATQRRDGSPGCTISRPLDGCEFPIHDFVSVSNDTELLTFVSPDIFAADVQPDGTIRATLVRSPCYAHHDPTVLPADHGYHFTDQGIHNYEVSLIYSNQPCPLDIQAEVNRQSHPIWITESTLGMPPRDYEMP